MRQFLMAAVLSLLALSPQSAQNAPQVAVTPREALRGLEISPVPLNVAVDPKAETTS